MAIPISAQGYKKLAEELAQLKENRPNIIAAIKEAREQGDLRENAGYDAAREKQGMNEARINYLESRLAQANIIDLDKVSGNKVVFGCTVSLVDVETDEEKTYTILGPDEADLKKGSISFQSPVGSALLGHEVGDEVTIRIPKGNVVYEITHIRFLGSKLVE